MRATRTLLLLLLLAAAHGASAVPPIFEINDTVDTVVRAPALAADPNGGFVAVWTDYTGSEAGIRARRFDAAGAPRDASFEVSQPGYSYTTPAASVAVDPRGFSVVWNTIQDGVGTYAYIDPKFRRFQADDEPQIPETLIESGRLEIARVWDVATTVDGQSLVLVSDGPERFSPTDSHLFVLTYDSFGRRRGAPIRVTRRRLAGRLGPRIVTTAGGGFAVAWAEPPFGNESWTLVARAFDRSGRPRRDEVVISPINALFREAFDLAARPGGGLIVSWLDGLNTPSGGLVGSHHRVRLLDRDARPIGPAVEVGTEPLVQGASQAALAVAPDGSFAATWLNGPLAFGAGELLFRRFSAEGRPLGVEERLREVPTFEPPAITALADGSYVVATAVFRRGGPGSAIDYALQAQRVPRARPGADACTFDGHRLACDTAHDAGRAETNTLYASSLGEDVPLFGDLDGDRRDDFCLLREDRLRCDLDHDGDPMELTARFPRPSADAVPVLGDPDGEGRDDFCWVAGGRLECDTAHDGGSAEVVVTLASSLTGRPVLGDVDGDGADELCLADGGRFQCDLGHDGGAAELVIDTAFGTAGAQVFAADFDADGDDDPCFAEGGFFRCDTTHDGGSAERSVRFGSLTATPLMGNVDGI